MGLKLSNRRSEQGVRDDRIVVADAEIVLLTKEAQIHRVPQSRDHLACRPQIHTKRFRTPSSHTLLRAPAVGICVIGYVRRCPSGGSLFE